MAHSVAFIAYCVRSCHRFSLNEAGGHCGVDDDEVYGKKEACGSGWRPLFRAV